MRRFKSIVKSRLFTPLSFFSDVKEIVGDSPVDVVHLSPAVRGPSLNHPDAWKTTGGKCACAMEKNSIRKGVFSDVLWNGGNDYMDAMELGLVSERDKFETNLSKLTYKKPMIVITQVCREGRMLGEYINFLRDEKSIGCMITNRKKEGLAGFHFTGELETQRGIEIDHLDMF